jgi:hypothetical protein
VHPDRAEVEQRHRVSVRCPDRDRLPAHRDSACERDDSRRGGANVPAQVAGDVDAAMLAPRVRIVSEDEGSEHGAVDRPRPRLGGSGHGEAHEYGDEEGETAHGQLLVLDLDNSRRQR